MDTIIYKYETADTKEQKKIIEHAGQILREGGLVAFPTETVYGLGGDALQPEASQKIYGAKGRPSDNPLIIHIGQMSDLDQLVSQIPEKALALANAFWPGPLTMILNKSSKVPYETTGGLDTVALRMPSHPCARALIMDSGVCIAAPSANTSGRPSPTTAEHVREDLDGKIPVIIDGGKVGIGIESTIVDLTEDVPVILRPGYITGEMLEAVVGPVRVDPAILEENVNKDFAPKAPGMKYKHYAPKGDLTIVEGEPQAVAETINQLTHSHEMEKKTVAVIATEETRSLYKAPIVLSIGTRASEETIAANLYDILRQMDTLKVDYIYSESFADGHLGRAIMNRLLKAAGYQVIQL